MHYILDEPKILFSFFISMFYLLQYVGDCCKTEPMILQNRKRKHRVCAETENRVCTHTSETLARRGPTFETLVRRG